MKHTTTLLIVFSAFGLQICTIASITNVQPSESHALVAKHDLNGNGKIDVNERKAYLQELSYQHREEAKAFAAQQPVLSQQERLFYHPPKLTPELIQKYDANHDGKLDSTERLKISQDAADAAKAEFRRFDTNQDGTLDKEEMKAIQAKQAERERQSRPSTQSITNHTPKLP